MSAKLLGSGMGFSTPTRGKVLVAVYDGGGGMSLYEAERIEEVELEEGESAWAWYRTPVPPDWKLLSPEEAEVLRGSILDGGEAEAILGK